MPYSAGRMLASKIAYSARNSAGRIYPSLFPEIEWVISFIDYRVLFNRQRFLNWVYNRSAVTHDGLIPVFVLHFTFALAVAVPLPLTVPRAPAIFTASSAFVGLDTSKIASTNFSCTCGKKERYTKKELLLFR